MEIADDHRDTNMVSNFRSPVYVMSPIGFRTGGPEALHQLVDSLNRQGATALLTPYDVGRNADPVSEYRAYACEIGDLPGGGDGPFHLVLPELRLNHPIDSLEPVLNNPRVQVWIWWLSVDNSQHPAATRFNPVVPSGDNCRSILGNRRNPIRRLLEFPARDDKTRHVGQRLNLLMEKGVGFLAQSEYAADFCARAFNHEAHLVTDYLGPQALHNPPPLRPKQVAYNGIKSGPLAVQLRQYLDDFQLRPIKGMSPAKVAETLAESVVYIELGPLPGRDRLPREAARVGTPVVMLRRGAGQYPGDFPLPDEYRIPFDRSWAEATAHRIRGVAARRAEAQADQASFRQWVLGDRDRFDTEVRNWICDYASRL